MKEALLDVVGWTFPQTKSSPNCLSLGYRGWLNPAVSPLTMSYTHLYEIQTKMHKVNHLISQKLPRIWSCDPPFHSTVRPAVTGASLTLVSSAGNLGARALEFPALELLEGGILKSSHRPRHLTRPRRGSFSRKRGVDQ